MWQICIKSEHPCNFHIMFPLISGDVLASYIPFQILHENSFKVLCIWVKRILYISVSLQSQTGRKKSCTESCLVKTSRTCLQQTPTRIHISSVVSAQKGNGMKQKWIDSCLVNIKLVSQTSARTHTYNNVLSHIHQNWTGPQQLHAETCFLKSTRTASQK
jgi:hypothetical protein